MDENAVKEGRQLRKAKQAASLETRARRRRDRECRTEKASARDLTGDDRESIEEETAKAAPAGTTARRCQLSSSEGQRRCLPWRGSGLVQVQVQAQVTDGAAAAAQGLKLLELAMRVESSRHGVDRAPWASTSRCCAGCSGGSASRGMEQHVGRGYFGVGYLIS